MSAQLPLYARMRKTVGKTDLSSEQKDEFINNISKLDWVGIELVVALIRAHHMETSKKNDVSIPYHGTINGDDLVFDFDILPIPLKHILYNFTNLHINSMKEDFALVCARTP